MGLNILVSIDMISIVCAAWMDLTRNRALILSVTNELLYNRSCRFLLDADADDGPS